jgi:hypothetical protein
VDIHEQNSHPAQIKHAKAAINLIVKSTTKNQHSEPTPPGNHNDDHTGNGIPDNGAPQRKDLRKHARTIATPTKTSNLCWLVRVTYPGTLAKLIVADQLVLNLAR